MAAKIEDEAEMEALSKNRTGKTGGINTQTTRREEKRSVLPQPKFRRVQYHLA